jgi:hypothetical protein
MEKIPIRAVSDRANDSASRLLVLKYQLVDLEISDTAESSMVLLGCIDLIVL